MPGDRVTDVAGSPAPHRGAVGVAVRRGANGGQDAASWVTWGHAGVHPAQGVAGGAVNAAQSFVRRKISWGPPRRADLEPQASGPWWGQPLPQPWAGAVEGPRPAATAFSRHTVSLSGTLSAMAGAARGPAQPALQLAGEGGTEGDESRAGPRAREAAGPRS